MKRWISVLCVAVLILSTAACGQADGAYRQGRRLLRAGNYTEAYECFKSSADPRAAEELERLVFVPTEQTSTASYGKGSRQTYTYDKQGNLVRLDAIFEADEHHVVYTYDKKNRLLTVEGENITQEYTYDKAGNRLTYVRTHAETGVYTEEYFYDEENRHVETLITFENGVKLRKQVTEEETTTDAEVLGDCVYDDAGRLISQTHANGEVRSFAYDEYSNKVSERYSWGDTTIEWKYQWTLQYYPDGLSEPVADLRERTVQTRPVE